MIDLFFGMGQPSHLNRPSIHPRRICKRYVEKYPKKLLEMVSDVILQTHLLNININWFCSSRSRSTLNLFQMLSYTRSIKIYRTGTIAKLKKVVAIIPPLTAVPKDSRLTEPAPLKKTIGSKPRIKAKRCHQRCWSAVANHLGNSTSGLQQSSALRLLYC
jgi:hypothetical protein